MSSETPGGRLARAALRRREELDLTQLEVAAQGGPSNTTLSKIENGTLDVLARQTARRLDAGLHWEPGSARRVWNGEGEPHPVIEGLSPRDSSRLRAIIAESRDVDEETRAELLRVLDSA